MIQNSSEVAESPFILTTDFDRIKITLQSAVVLELSDVEGIIAVGDRISGDTSAANGTVIGISGNLYFIGQVAQGPFTVSETVTDPDGPGTATVDAVSDPSFSLLVYGSYNNSYSQPTFSEPLTQENEYHLIAYTNEGDLVNYDIDNPFQETTTETTSFSVGVDGINWIAVAIVGEPVTGGVSFVDVDLFNLNHV